MRKTEVLIAEDMEILREDFAEMVESDETFHVAARASTGKEAVEACDREEIDIALMDIEMESADAGIKATEAILLVHPQVKVIYLTAHETDETIITAMATGAVDYIVKGCDKSHLLDHMHRTLDGESMLDPKINRVVMNEYLRLHRSEQSLSYFIRKLGTLTPTEKELVRLILQDKKVKEMAKERNVEVVTIKTQIHGLLEKFDCTRTTEVRKVIEELGIAYLFQ
jgi:NarL family two-component system response regulator LiaR